jgi:hypothetical protein
MRHNERFAASLQLLDIPGLGFEQEVREMPMHYIADDLRQPLQVELADLVRGAERLLGNWVAFEEFLFSEVIQLPTPPRPIDLPDAA